MFRSNAPTARERLLASAERLFAERGLHGVSVRELVDDAAATRPVLYHHFGSKEGLYRAAVRRSAERFEAALADAANGAAPAAERLARVCRVHAQAVREGALVLAEPDRGVRERVVLIVRELLSGLPESASSSESDVDATSLALVAAAEFSARLPDARSALPRRECPCT